VLAAKLRAAHRLAQFAEVEGRTQPCRESVRGVVGHGFIVGSFPPEAKGVPPPLLTPHFGTGRSNRGRV
jgi:hypothetical protein